MILTFGFLGVALIVVAGALVYGLSAPLSLECAAGLCHECRGFGESHSCCQCPCHGDPDREI